MGCLQLRRGKVGIEAEEREGCRRGLHVGGGNSGEKEWKVQGRRHAQFEVEGEACTPGTQGCEPFHQGALCVQSEASLEDREGLRHEEVEGCNQLRWFRWLSRHNELSRTGRGVRSYQA